MSVTTRIRRARESFAALLHLERAADRASRVQQLATLQLLALSVALVTFVIFGAYGGVNVLAYNYVASDRWCDLGSESLGVHCFSDFHQFVLIPPGETLGDALNTSQGRSPIGGVMSDIFSALGALSPRGALVLWVLLSALLMLIPVLWSTRGLARAQRIQSALLLGMLTLPFWAVLDRGQQMALAVPLMLMYGIALIRDRFMWAAVSAGALFLVKPYLVLLIIPLLAHRKIKPVLVWLTTVCIGLVISFLPYGLTALERIRSWTGQLLGVGEVQGLRFDTSPSAETITVSYPYDYSLLGGLTDVTYRVSTVLNVDGLLRAIEGVTLVSALLSAILITFLVIVRQYVEPTRWVIAVLAAANFAVTPAYSYQLAFTLVGIALIIAFGQSAQGDDHGEVRDDRLRPGLVLVALVLSLTPLIVPLQLPSVIDPFVASEIPLIDNIYPMLLTILWYVFIVLTISRGFAIMRRAEKALSNTGARRGLTWVLFPLLLLLSGSVLWSQARDGEQLSLDLQGFEQVPTSFGQAGSGFGKSLALESDLFVTGGAERTIYFPADLTSGSDACLGGQVRFALDGIQVRFTDTSGAEQAAHDFSTVGSTPHRLVLTPDGRSLFVQSDSVQSVTLEQPICVNVAGAELAAAPSEALLVEVGTPSEALQGTSRFGLVLIGVSIGALGLGALSRRRTNNFISS